MRWFVRLDVYIFSKLKVQRTTSVLRTEASTGSALEIGQASEWEVMANKKLHRIRTLIWVTAGQAEAQNRAYAERTDEL